MGKDIRSNMQRKKLYERESGLCHNDISWFTLRWAKRTGSGWQESGSVSRGQFYQRRKVQALQISTILQKHLGKVTHASIFMAAWSEIEKYKQLQCPSARGLHKPRPVLMESPVPLKKITGLAQKHTMIYMKEESSRTLCLQIRICIQVNIHVGPERINWGQYSNFFFLLF